MYIIMKKVWPFLCPFFWCYCW